MFNALRSLFLFSMPTGPTFIFDNVRAQLRALIAPDQTFNGGETREIIVSFLNRCRIPFPTVPIDQDFDATCRAEALRRGYPTEGPDSLQDYFAGGVTMATTAYAHLQSKPTQIFIALYTAFLIYLDDAFQHDIRLVEDFNERFIRYQPQGNKVLDSFADLLLGTSKHFGKVVSNIIVTSTLNLVSALLLEHETQGMTIRGSAYRYPTFSRVMSGASEAYALFIFAPQFPLQWYIQALPEIMIFINNGNDILSFYKEQLAGETVNRISSLAACNGTTKHHELSRLADDAIDAHQRVLKILAPFHDSITAYNRFSRGYVGFHAVLRRYRLDELRLRRL